MADFEDETGDYVDPSNFEGCGICGRTFRPDVLMKHERICQKSSNKTRKAFDSSKQRLTSEIVQTKKQPEKKLPPSKAKKQDWRAKHEEFIANIRAARGVSHALKTGGPLPPPPKATINPDYVQCPTCERRFNEHAADRHIPWCAEKAKRIHPNSKAEQLKTRTQYKPPLPGKRANSGSKTNSGMTNGRMGSGGHSNGYSSSSTGRTKRPSLEKPGRLAGVNRHPHQNSYHDNDDDTDYSGLNSLRGTGYGGGDSYKAGSGGSRRGSAGSSRSGSSGSLGNRAIKSKPPSGTSQRPSSGSLKRQPSLENINGKRASKFCHECGTKYPVPQAKYCCECGTKRMWIT
ncbi:zinc finger C2HC domain-containing protein 1A-like isoform X2 [Glandiceps talaboti]